MKISQKIHTNRVPNLFKFYEDCSMYVFRTSILVSITLENCIAVLCNADFTPCHIELYIDFILIIKQSATIYINDGLELNLAESLCFLMTNFSFFIKEYFSDLILFLWILLWFKKSKRKEKSLLVLNMI